MGGPGGDMFEYFKILILQGSFEIEEETKVLIWHGRSCGCQETPGQVHQSGWYYEGWVPGIFCICLPFTRFNLTRAKTAHHNFPLLQLPCFNNSSGSVQAMKGRSEIIFQTNLVHKLTIHVHLVDNPRCSGSTWTWQKISSMLWLTLWWNNL